MVELVSEHSTLRKSFAGDTYNTAVYMKRCAPHIQVDYLTAIGADFLSDELLLSMGEQSISSHYVFRHTQKNLGLYMVRTDSRGERSFAYWRSDSAAKHTINLLDTELKNIDAFYFSGISLAIIDLPQRETLFAQLESLRQQGCKIIFDPNYRPALWSSKEEAIEWCDRAYSVADIAFPGGDDHKALYGHQDCEAILAHMQGFDIDELIVKNGAQGVHIIYQQTHKIVPVERVTDVVDTTAAGDAFNAGYLAARFCDRSCIEAVGYGAKVAATVIGYKGAILSEPDFYQHVSKLNS